MALEFHNAPYLCTNCYEVGKGYRLIASGQKRCMECGGVVLNLQEAADYIAQLKSELEDCSEDRP